MYKLYYIERIHEAQNKSWENYYIQLLDYEMRNKFIVSTSEGAKPILDHFITISYSQLTQNQQKRVKEIIKTYKSIPESGLYYDTMNNNYYFCVGFTGSAEYVKI